MVRTIEARAPTRIDFGGGWTDVPPYSEEQGGCVCNLAIARHAVARITALDGRVVIEDAGQRHQASSAAALAHGGGAELIKAALRRSVLDDVRVAMRCDFPSGAGLGGSSAAGVAMVAAAAAWRDEQPARAEIAERSRALEVEELGIAGGKQDHYAAAFGGALGLWFDDAVRVRRIALSDALTAAIEARCVVVYTGQSRISGETITAVIDAYRAREPRVTAALARMRELATLMIATLERGSVDELGALVAEHWATQRALHPLISTVGIERVLAAAHGAGAIGGKALGASGGGCVLAIAAQGREAELREAVARTGELLPFAVDREGVRVTIQPEDAPAI